jgi:hypothetical protein
VSDYPPPLSKLPGVAADARAMAALLSSRNGSFPREGVTVIDDGAATQRNVLASLRRVFYGAKSDETIFVYFAGHGGVEKRAYYFLAQDADPYRLAETGVPLTEIKRLFERSASRRVFVWLDCCHSGGILARGKTAADDLSVLKREIGVVQGEGKIIVAACASDQKAYECPKLGHGLFTHALLRGLRGEARGVHGEVTATSLYEYIDREVTHPLQQPVFQGRMAGRIILMHYPSAVPGPSPTKANRRPATRVADKPGPAGPPTPAGNLVLLADRVYTIRSADELNDGSWKLEIVQNDADEAAALRSLRTDRFGRGRTVSFAFDNEAFPEEVEGVTARSLVAGTLWTVALKPAPTGNDHFSDVTYNGIPPEEMAEMRARLLLLGESPPRSEIRRDSFLMSTVLGPLKDLGVKGAVLPTLRKDWNGVPADFRRHARLRLAYFLKAGRVCDDILELSLGPERKGMIAVKFRGSRRSHYAGAVPQPINVDGLCPLSGA